MTTALVVAGVALLLALLALAVALLAFRRADDTNTRMRQHTRDHEGRLRSHREGTVPERRRVDLGPPRSTGERRGVDVGPPTVEHAPPTTAIRAQGPTPLPRPGRIPR